MAARKKNNAPRKRQTVEAGAGVEPSVRVFTSWTPALIRSAELAADNGNLRQAANLCEWLLGDDRIGPLLHTRVQTLLGLVPSFDPSGDKRRSKRAVNALDAQEDWWTAYPETELAQLHTWGLMLGVAPAQHRWTSFDDHGGRLLPMPEFWHPQHLRYDTLTRRWLIRVRSEGSFSTGGEEVELVPGDARWLLHTPYGKNRPWAWGLWRALAPLRLLKILAISDWAQHSEKGALHSVEADKEAVSITDAQRRQLAQDIYNRGRDGVIVLPPGFSMKLIETVANTKTIYEAQVELANKCFAIAIRGGNLTSDVQGGSLAATQQQAESNEKPKLRFDAESLTGTLHGQSLVHWAEFNYGDRKLAPWPVYPVEEQEDLLAKADGASKAFDAVTKAVTLGFEVDQQGFVEEYKLTGWIKPSRKLLKVPLQSGTDAAPEGGELESAADQDPAEPEPETNPDPASE